MKQINMAILGAGNIARQMAVAVNGLQDQVCAYAVASRSLKKAEAFAREWHFQKAYGSYEELAEEKKVFLTEAIWPAISPADRLWKDCLHRESSASLSPWRRSFQCR